MLVIQTNIGVQGKIGKFYQSDCYWLLWADGLQQQVDGYNVFAR